MSFPVTKQRAPLPATPAILNACNLIEAWFDNRLFAPGTETRYRDHLLQLIELESINIFTMTRAQFNNYLRSLRRQYAPSTVAGAAYCITSWYTWLHAEGHIERNPALLLDIPRADPAATTTIALTADEYDCYLSALERWPVRSRARAKVIVRLMVCCGMRPAEVAGLTTGGVRISRGKLTLAFTGKGGVPRSATVDDPETATALDTYLTARAGRAVWWRVLFADTRVIVTEQGKPMPAREMHRAAVRLGQLSGLDTGPHTITVNPQVLRATFATLAEEAGAEDEAIQAALGHRSPSMTRHYIKRVRAVDFSAVAAISQARRMRAAYRRAEEREAGSYSIQLMRAQARASWKAA